jgi:hypothetical protein
MELTRVLASLRLTALTGCFLVGLTALAQWS